MIRNAFGQLVPATTRDRDGMAVIGRTLHDLRGIRFVEGEEGDKPDAAAQQAAADAAVAAQAEAAAQAAAAAAQGGDQKPADEQPVEGSADGGKTFSPEYVKKLRDEAASYRTRIEAEAKAAAEKAEKDLTQRFGKALGFIKDDEQPDPTALLAQAQAEKDAAAAEAKQTKVELAVFRAASKHSANVEALSDSLTFQKKAQALDPTADDFASQVDALIAETVTSNPAKYKAVQVAASTGGTHHTGQEAGQITREELKAMSASDRLKAHREGRTKSLLGN